MEREETEIENFQRCKYRMKEEGFHYCFHGYSNWKEIKDKTFHELRKQYLDCAQQLEDYINEKANEDEF
jgi:hypothetical protein